MPDTLIQIIFGWPAIIASLIVSVIGLWWKRPWLLLIGAVLFLPFSYYLSGAPAIRGLALVLPLFQAGAAYAGYQKKTPLAWLLTLPALLVSGWLAFLVSTQ